MLDALSAEALKMRTHKATWFLVWLYPIAVTVIFLIAISITLAGLAEETQADPDAAGWIADTTGIWLLPGNSVGRFLIAAYVAVVFAGEYGWNTWKLIVPHRARGSLIAAKYALVLLLLAASFTLTAALSLLGAWANDLANGDALPAGLTAGAIAGMHGKAALAALAGTLVTIAYASFAAILTRSTIAALVVSIVAISIEQIIASFGPMLSTRFPAVIVPLFHALPGYHLGNLSSWIQEGQALSAEFPGGRVVALSWAASVAVIAAWVASLVTAAFAAFKRQDIN
ncbi:MAG TPA: ABC transporter permease [Allosphingosinicella sp.]|nr:ABC transporter permease [Allosphingosinicella sp.]